MPQLQYPAAAIPGVPRENAFQSYDDDGMRSGTSAVVEYINHALLPERPLNYYISISAKHERAFDMLIGAALARSYVLRQRHGRLKARIYAPCRPQDTDLLRSLQDAGFQNDDASVRMRRILMDGDRFPNPPVGCELAPVMLEDQEDCQALLDRLSAYSVTAFDMNWLAKAQRETLFAVYGLWMDHNLLGEMVLTAYGAEGRIEMLYVRPEYRRRGIAAALIGSAASMLLSGGIHSLTADVWRRNVPAMETFTALGFESLSPVMLYPGINL